MQKVARTIGIGLIVAFGVYLAAFSIDVLTTPETTPKNLAAADQHLIDSNLPRPHNAFTTDGCTAWPDFLLWHNFYDACIAHDIAYWAGGSDDQKYRADLELARDVRHTGPLGPLFAFIMFTGVHHFGNNLVSNILDSNWGYGWN